MAFGLNIFKADGSLKLSISDRITRHIGTVTGTLSANEVRFIASPIQSQNGWFATLKASVSGSNNWYGSAGFKTYYNGQWGVAVRNTQSSNQLLFTLDFMGY